jgi:hypothetical protein
MQHVIGRELVDFQEIHLGFKLGQFGYKLVEPCLGGFPALYKRNLFCMR